MRALKTPGVPSEAKHSAHTGHQLHFQPWCGEHVEAQDRDRSQQRDTEALDEDEVSSAQFDFFFAGKDNLNKKAEVTDLQDKGLICELDPVEKMKLAQLIIMADKCPDDYESARLAETDDFWELTELRLLHGPEPVCAVLRAGGARRRYHYTLARGSPETSYQGRATTEKINGLAPSLITLTFDS